MDILGLQELAVLLEVNKRTPHAWKHRGVLPPADYSSINGLEAWNRDTILAWAKETGRLPPSMRPADDPFAVQRGGRRTHAELEAERREAERAAAQMKADSAEVQMGKPLGVDPVADARRDAAQSTMPESAEGPDLAPAGSPAAW